MKNKALALAGLVALLFSMPIFALTPAEQCQSLQCIRSNINAIDQQIVILLGQRLANDTRAGELKKNQKTIHDQAREDKILKTVSKQAEKAGYSGNIAKAVFKEILVQANIYERKVHQQLQ